jgi:hypothetical protein
LADPHSSDPIARESTRLTCAAVLGAQTSLDPIQVREWIPNANYGGHAFGFKREGRTRPQEFALLIENRDKLLPEIREYSPIELVSPGDPPIFLEYPNQNTPPMLGHNERDPTHSALYGIKLAERLRENSIEAVVNYPGHESPVYKSLVQFLIEKLTRPGSSRN